MVHYEDLSPCGELPEFPSRAVGWLEPEHDYPKGQVSEKFLEALERLLKFRWTPYTAAGFHECGLCQSEPARGLNELIVPAKDGFFVCPTLILHYIQGHSYKPPSDFQQAVLDCPPTESKAYFDALEARGLIAVWEKFCGPNLRTQHFESSRELEQITEDIPNLDCLSFSTASKPVNVGHTGMAPLE